MPEIKLKNTFNPKPFLKWAGGKTQLLKEYNKRLPKEIINSKIIDSYIEPFVGGGAFFFFLKKYYKIKKSFLLDINRELVIAYKVVQKDYEELIDQLSDIESEHLGKNAEERKKEYYKIRENYNSHVNIINYNKYNESWIERAAQLIFLNKTCYNGLFRQNKKGEFNVPYGRYNNPKICDENNIIAVNKALKTTKIFCNDFTKSLDYVEKGSLVYLDPPYRPLSNTSKFTSYAKEGFNDKDQKRLADFFEKLNKKGAFLILSNSDPKNEDLEDEFFEILYKNYVIERIPAKRHINRDKSKRGQINELIIRNY
jgi:DNA adenine methylase